MTLRPPNPNETSARYTTTALVKERLTIPATDVTRDAEILQSIIGAEYAIDTFCGRGFPDFPAAQLVSVWKSTGTTLAAADGEVSATLTTVVELRKVDFNGVDQDTELADVTQIVIDAFVFDVASFVETADLWTFTGTIDSGTFPTDGTLVEVIVGKLALADATINIVPDSVEVAALDLAIAFWKEADSPTGSAGSDDFFGSISTSETTRMMLQRNPGLVGFRVSWGVA